MARRQFQSENYTIITVMILHFWTDRPDQGLKWLPLGLHFWTHNYMVLPTCSNFKGITANFSGVHFFRNFTVSATKNCTQELSHVMRKPVLYHMRTTKMQISLISAFVVCCLNIIISILAKSKVSTL